MLYLELGFGVLAFIPCIREWRHYNDTPQFDWSTMRCIKNGTMESESEVTEMG